MAIQVDCPCGHRLKAPDHLAGKKARCPHCKNALDIPVPTVAAADVSTIRVFNPEKARPAAAKAPAAPPPAAPEVIALALDEPAALSVTDDDLTINIQDEPPAQPTPKPPAPARAAPPASSKPAPPRPSTPSASLPIVAPAPSDAIELAEPILELPPAPRAPAAAPAPVVTAEPPAGEPSAAPKNSRFARVNARRYANENAPHPWFHLAGIDFTPIKTIVALVIVAIIAGIILWYILGPARAAHVLAVQPVNSFTAIETMHVLEPGSLAEGTLYTADSRAGVKLPPVISQNKKLNKNILPMINTEDVLAVGGGDTLTLTRPNPQGDFLLVRMNIKQSALDDAKQTSRYDMVLAMSAFKVQVGGRTINPALLVTQLPQVATVEYGTSYEEKAVLIPGITPTKQDSKPGFGNSYSGNVSYDGSQGAKGELKFHKATHEIGSSLSVSGKVDYTDPHGAAIQYNYQGSSVDVTWDDVTDGWRSTNTQKKKAGDSPWNRYQFALLFPRPKASEGKMVITLMDKPIASVSASYGSSEKDAALAAAAGAAGAGASGNAGGNPAGGAAKPEEGGIKKKIDDTVDAANYLGALGKGRQRGLEVIASVEMQQILQIIIQYMQNHQNQPPPNLEALHKDFGNVEKLLTNPRTREYPGYIYVKPSDHDLDSKMPSEIPVLYESKGGKPDPNGATGYLDGHIVTGSLGK